MSGKRFFRVIAAACCASLVVGYGSSAAEASPDLSLVQRDISMLSVPEHVRIAGLGEASHGVSEYQVMKAEVFRALVKNNGCRTFIIEGDFGGALKVDEYIHGGDGTAREAVREIGFAIYCTGEMMDLIDWMRAYNETAPEGEDLHFYGMDMQRLDNNKEYVFTALESSMLELSETYQAAFSQLTDENMASLSKDALKAGAEDALDLIKDMDSAEDVLTDSLGHSGFELARECANTIYECCNVQLTSANYNAVRDRYMFEKTEWFLRHGDGSLLFLNGHNGHIGKSSVAGYTCLGELLSGEYGDQYFAIGTDAQYTGFNSQGDQGEFVVMEVENSNELNSLLDGAEDDFYYVDFSAAGTDEKWNQILSSRQKITTLNVGLAEWQKLLKVFYTADVVPQDIFDGMIVFHEVSPSALN